MHLVAFCLSDKFFSNEPEDDTPSKMDDGNLNSTLVRKDKKWQIRSLYEDLIILQQDQMEV